MRMLDLFCGRWGWSRTFAARGWECVGIDLTPPPEIPPGCTFIQRNVLEIDADYVREFDFACASPPCEQFSVHGMKHFHPNPPFPELGLKLFNHTRQILADSGVPHVIENVRAAQKFVGNAVHHCGPFYLWGNAVPPLMPQNIKKGFDTAGSFYKGRTRAEIREYLKANNCKGAYNSKSKEAQAVTAKVATIPPELASCVADYAEYLCATEVVFTQPEAGGKS